jgi:hypothetical protein
MRDRTHSCGQIANAHVISLISVVVRWADVNAAVRARIDWLGESSGVAVPVGYRGLYGQIPLPEGQLSLAMNVTLIAALFTYEFESPVALEQYRFMTSPAVAPQSSTTVA